MLDDKDIQLVQSSFEWVKPITKEAADLFYSRLFILDPSLKPLFPSELSGQGQKLMNTLNLVVSGLKEFATVVPIAKNLAVKHVQYGVNNEDYSTVGKALVWTLETAFGDNFTDSHKRAWENTYMILSETMIEAANKSKENQFNKPT